MSSYNGGEPSDNPWSLDLNNMTAPLSQLHQAQQQTYQLSAQYEAEVERLRSLHEENVRYVDMRHQENWMKLKQDVEEIELKMSENHSYQIEQLKGFYETQLNQQKSFYEQQMNMVSKKTDKLDSELSELRVELEIAHQQQRQKEIDITSLKTQLKDMTHRSEKLLDKSEDLEREVSKLQFTCDTLRAENRKLTFQKENVEVTRQDIERDRRSQQLFDSKKSGDVSHLTNIDQQKDNHSMSSKEDDTRSESFASVSEAWDSQSIGSATPSIVSQARDLAVLANTHRVNSGHTTAAKTTTKNTTNRQRHPTPAFFGNNSPTSQQWLQQFRKVIIYHQYNETECIAEFMMAMQGHANAWWDSQDSTTKNSFELLITSFEKFYGGSKASMARSIATLKTLAQNKEPMSTFCPRLMNLFMVVAKDNVELQLSFFYAAVDSKVADSVLATRPGSLVDAVNVAIELEQGSLYKTGGPSTSRSTVVPPVDWTPMAPSSSNDPMDVDVNAQYARQKNWGQKDKVTKCYVCDRTNHVMKDCRLLQEAKNKAKDSQGKKYTKGSFNKKKNYRPETKNSNAQQALQVEGTINQKDNDSDNLEMDITNSYFHFLHQNNQEVQTSNLSEQLIPTITGGLNDATNFILDAFVSTKPTGEVLKTKVLVDTGANISTITRREAETLLLPFSEAAPLRIVYGNASSGVSTQAVWMSCNIQGMDLGGFYLRVVETQNLPFILGMDWLIQKKLLLDPLYKQLIPRSSITGIIGQVNAVSASEVGKTDFTGILN